MSEIAQSDDQIGTTAADHMLIDSGWVRLQWLPYVVAVIGLTLSILFGLLLFKDIRAYIDVINELQTYLPWIALIMGSALTFLLSILIRAAQLTRQQASRLKKINEELRIEMQGSMAIKESNEKLEKALQQGQKLQAMGTLAGGIAHDFNNLLYAIIGYIEMARDDVEKDGQLYLNLGKVLEACQRGQELVSRILTFSRRQHHQLDVLNLKPAIETVLALLNQTIPSSVMLQFCMEKETTVLGNKTLLHQILVNIINNAVDAMDGEGVININVTSIAISDPFLKQFPDMSAASYCKIEIKDTGHGMDKATVERIFEPFYTTKDVGKGTGLGLSIVHSIVKEHKGEVTVISELGKGSTFTILLPEYFQL